MPPEYLWEDNKGLELWWASVEEKRQRELGGERPPGTSGDDPHQPTDMAENEYARAL